MFNFAVTRLPYLPIIGICFATGVCLGGLGGLLLGISAQNVIGILGGMFFGLVFGIGFALFGLIFTAVFNVIAPHIGGLPVELTPIMPLDTGNTTKTSEPAD